MIESGGPCLAVHTYYADSSLAFVCVDGTQITVHREVMN